MVFTLDIGNTNIKCALFDGYKMISYWRISTDRRKTHDEYGIMLCSLFAHEGRDMSAVEGIIFSSVVPSINFTIEHMLKDYFDAPHMQVLPGIKTGINLRYENPRELGSDRIANAVAAYEYYGGPCIFIDFGTATSFGVLSGKGEFLGGAICPGLQLSTEALTERAAQLPKIELIKPASVIARNTIQNMQAGIVYGYVGQVEYIVRRMRGEIGDKKARVIATGGLGHLIASETEVIETVDGELTLKGLRLLYERNRA